MKSDNIILIREAITQARIEEAQTHKLGTFLDAAAHNLHNAIALPKDDPGKALFEFILHYIEHVPDFLQTLDDLMQSCGLHEHGRVFITIAEDFFLQPPELVRQCGGLQGLIDEAYLAHRLMEEVNDRLTMLCGVPLTPLDMTLANIIVHDLLGEAYANQLDLAVHFAVEALFEQSRPLENTNLAQFVARYQACDWEAKLRGWPSMKEESNIRLHFAKAQPTAATAH